MVKKAVAAINSDGTEKAYAEIDDPKGSFVDRDLYIVVYRMEGLVLAHGADKTRIGVNLLHDKDVDGKEFVKERVSLPRPSRASGRPSSRSKCIASGSTTRWCAAGSISPDSRKAAGGARKTMQILREMSLRPGACHRPRRFSVPIWGARGYHPGGRE